MEFLISRSSIESHTFVRAGVICPTLKDVLFFTGLHIFEEARTIKLLGYWEVALDEEVKRNVEALNNAVSESKTYNKAFYLWCRGRGDMEFDAMLSYWLQWYVLPSDPEGGLNSTYLHLLADWLQG